MARILVISATPTHPPVAGNRIRILTLMEHLEARGDEVHFLHVDREPGDEKAMADRWGDRFHVFRYARPRRPKLRPWYLPYWMKRGARAMRRGESLSHHNYGLDDWYDRRLDPVLHDLHGRYRFDVVIVEYVYLSRAFRALELGTLKILDTLDVFGDRYRRYLDHDTAPTYFSCSVGDEAVGIRRADAVLAIQEEEAAYFRSLSDRPVLHVGHPVPIHDALPIPSAPRLLFVGSSNTINVEAVAFFVQETLPRIRERVSDAMLVLAGDICEAVVDAPGIEKRGRVESLEGVYAEARCVLNMRRFGTGLSIKSIEAMAYGRPLVATPSGAAGLESVAGSAFLLANGPEAFAQAVVRVLQEDQVAADLASSALAFVRDYNERCFAELDALIDQHG